MSTKKLLVVGAIVILGLTIVSVTLLLIFGSTDTQSLITDGLMALGGLATSGGLAWLAARLRRDVDQDGIPDVLQEGERKPPTGGAS